MSGYEYKVLRDVTEDEEFQCFEHHGWEPGSLAPTYTQSRFVRVRKKPKKKWTIAGSRSHLDHALTLMGPHGIRLISPTATWSEVSQIVDALNKADPA